jgi:serine/threonine protein kinase
MLTSSPYLQVGEDVNAGTPGFMPPEQLLHGKVNQSSDLYGLEQDYNSAQPKLKQYINHWFGANVEDLIEATYISCPSKDIEREDFIIELIERIAE